MDNMTSDLLTAQEAAAYLGPHVTASMLRRHARLGLVRATRTPGGGWRFDPADLDLYRPDGAA